MTYTEKVLGTTKRQQEPWDNLVGEVIPKERAGRGVAEFKTQAILVPEPTNPFDATAVAVLVSKKDGTVHHVGYIAKDSPLKEQVTKATLVALTIYDYDMIGLKNSYVIETLEVGG